MKERYYFFCDDSCITKEEFLVIGGLAMRAPVLGFLNHYFEAYRQIFQMHAEMKWEKLTNQKQKEYRYLVDLFFDSNQQDDLDFHCLIVPDRRFDHKIAGKGDRASSLHRMQYQLLLHRFCRIYGSLGADLYIHPDLSSSPLPELDVQRMLKP